MIAKFIHFLIALQNPFRFNITLTHMDIPFNKYHGTDNDFIIIGNRTGIFTPSKPVVIKRICDRRFGIGAGGLILTGQSVYADFRMICYN